MKTYLVCFLLVVVSIARADLFDVQETEVKDPYAGKKSVFSKSKETKESSWFSSPTSLSENFSGGTYDDTLSMRSQRRVGAGFQVGGQAGMAGINLELNITPENSALLGFGGGPKYNSFSLAWKYIFGGNLVAPYFSTTLSRWYNSSKGSANFNESNPGFLADKFLTGDERRSGIFGKDLLIPALGLQMNLLKGQYAGFSLYAEVMLVFNLSSLDQVPTGAMGSMYYF
jgi:hypothetical protein